MVVRRGVVPGCLPDNADALPLRRDQDLFQCVDECPQMKILVVSARPGGSGPRAGSAWEGKSVRFDANRAASSFCLRALRARGGYPVVRFSMSRGTFTVGLACRAGLRHDPAGHERKLFFKNPPNSTKERHRG